MNNKPTITQTDYKALQTLCTALKEQVDKHKATIQGLDRAYVRHTEIIEQYRKENERLQEKVKEQDDMIAMFQLLERDGKAVKKEEKIWTGTEQTGGQVSTQSASCAVVDFLQGVLNGDITSMDVGAYEQTK